MGISPSCDQFAVDNPGLVDESGCPPDAMAEDAAVNVVDREELLMGPKVTQPARAQPVVLPCDATEP